jgi:phosphoenolpyruvate carboxykinase (ATP)
MVSSHGDARNPIGLDRHGITAPGEVYWNLSPAELYEHAIRAKDGAIAANGAIVCLTAPHTGRSPADKFIVEEPSTKDRIWWGKVNVPIGEKQFDQLHGRVVEHFRGRNLYVRDMFAGADEASRQAIRVVTETAWHNLFACQLFIRPASGASAKQAPAFTILNAPLCKADPETDGTRSPTFVVVHFGKKLILIGGTAYAGEIKKSIFTVMNYVLPVSGVLSMHCSANVGAKGDVALFFGLSGTGKTTLSADPERGLIGDDEHGWSDRGVFNIEGGCYAKCIRLSEESEPQIYRAIRFGTVLENVVIDPATRTPNYDTDDITENTRAAYPLEHIDNAVHPSVGGHPRNVLFLTCDAFGVLPPIAKLSPEQAMYHFLSGYTAKVAGTERGVTEPQTTFSTCFGAPFLPLPPQTYAKMLGKKLEEHDVRCWLVNTGWSGGGYGVGQRTKLSHTRAMVRAALSGALDNAAYRNDPVFGIAVPGAVPDVPAEILIPRSTWRDPAAYDAKARDLARRFVENFKQFEDTGVAGAGPKI